MASTRLSRIIPQMFLAARRTGSCAEGVGRSRRRLRSEPRLERLESRSLLAGDISLVAPTSLPSLGPVETPLASASSATLASIVVKAPLHVPSGQVVYVAAMAVDAAGQPIRDYAGTAIVTSSDPLARLPESVTFQAGRVLVPIVFHTSGEQVITITDAADPSISASATTRVAQPIVATSILVAVPAQVVAGRAAPVKMIAVDAAGRPVPTFTGTASITTSDPGATATQVSFINGRAQGTVTFAASGPQTLTVTSHGDAPISGAAATNVLIPQVLTRFGVFLPVRAPVGGLVTAIVAALDANGRPIRGFAGTVGLTCTDPLATVPESVTLQDGRASIVVRFGTAGEQTLTATGGELTGSGSITVLAPPTLAGFAVLMPKTVVARLPVTVVLAAIDNAGKPLAGFTGDVTVSSSDPLVRLLPGTTVKVTNGRAVLRAVFGTEGRQTLTVTGGVDGSLSGSAATLVVTSVRATPV